MTAEWLFPELHSLEEITRWDVTERKRATAERQRKRKKKEL